MKESMIWKYWIGHFHSDLRVSSGLHGSTPHCIHKVQEHNNLYTGSIGVQLSGQNPTPNYAGQLIQSHIEDYGFTRYEMGYAAAVSVALLGLIYAFSFVARKLFAPKDE